MANCCLKVTALFFTIVQLNTAVTITGQSTPPPAGYLATAWPTKSTPPNNGEIVRTVLAQAEQQGISTQALESLVQALTEGKELTIEQARQAVRDFSAVLTALYSVPVTNSNQSFDNKIKELIAYTSTAKKGDPLPNELEQAITTAIEQAIGTAETNWSVPNLVVGQQATLLGAVHINHEGAGTTHIGNQASTVDITGRTTINTQGSHITAIGNPTPESTVVVVGSATNGVNINTSFETPLESPTNINAGTSIGVVNVATGKNNKIVNIGTSIDANTITIGNDTDPKSVTHIFGGAANGVNINTDTNSPTRINCGSSTGTVEIANGESPKKVDIVTGPAASTINIGTNTAAHAITLGNPAAHLYMNGDTTINENVNRETLINTGSSTGTVSIGNPNAHITLAGAVEIGQAAHPSLVTINAASPEGVNIVTNGAVTITDTENNPTSIIKGDTGTAWFADRVSIGTPKNAQANPSRVALTSHGIILTNAINAEQITSSSDRAIKTDVNTLKPNEHLNAIQKLRPVSYHVAPEWAQRNGLNQETAHLGLLADEIRPVYPEVVHDTGIEQNGEKIYGVDYSRLTVPLIATVQALMQKMNDLNSKMQIVSREIRMLQAFTKAPQANLNAAEFADLDTVATHSA